MQDPQNTSLRYLRIFLFSTFPQPSIQPVDNASRFVGAYEQTPAKAGAETAAAAATNYCRPVAFLDWVMD
jgi:hypothetical protein